MKRLLALLLLFASGAGGLGARVDLLLVPPAQAVSGKPAETEFVLYLNNPSHRDETVVLPAEIAATYASEVGRGWVRLGIDHPGDEKEVTFAVPAMTRRAVTLRLKEALPGGGGFVSLRLGDPVANTIMFELSRAAEVPATEPAQVGAAEANRKPDVAKVAPPMLAEVYNIDLANDLEVVRRHIFSYDPIYFAVGDRERVNARFQFSFKYRVFEAGPPGEDLVEQLVRGIHFGYTQQSIWDLESFSKPFYDSSYKPTLFILHERWLDEEQSKWISLQFGAQHESNGKGGGPAPVVPDTGLASPTEYLKHPSDSRSLNSLYFAPKMRWISRGGWFAEVGLRAIAYFQIDENPDIATYRGHVEATVKAGRDRGLQLAAYVRGSPRGHGSAEFDLSWPATETPLLRHIIPHSLGGYAQIQYFNGYGESLLDYDVRREDQLRFGLMIVR